MNQSIAEANKFLDSLKFGQWYSSQMNPLLVESVHVETTTDQIKTTKNTHKYEFVVMTYYLDEHELAIANKKSSNMLSS